LLKIDGLASVVDVSELPVSIARAAQRDFGYRDISYNYSKFLITSKTNFKKGGAMPHDSFTNYPQSLSSPMHLECAGQTPTHLLKN